MGQGDGCGGREVPLVFVALPRYGGQAREEVFQAIYCLCRRRDQSRPLNVHFRSVRCSLLAHTMNRMWAEAQDMGADYFAMVHADVQPGAGWLDDLLDLRDAHAADVLSAVVAIKDGQGLTSTAIDDPADPWRPWCRLTVRECAALPSVFDAEAAGHGGRTLLVNTGCMLVRLGPWARGVCFTIRDRIVEGPDGTLEAQVQPEDWDFARQCHDLGLRVLATTAVRTDHWSEGMAFPCGSGEDWGSLDADDNCGRARQS